MKISRVFVAVSLLSVVTTALILGLQFIISHTKSIDNFRKKSGQKLHPWQYNEFRMDTAIMEPEKYRTACTCGSKSEVTLDKFSKQRRFIERQDWKRLHASSEEPLAECKSFSPFQYIGSGITVQPLGSTKLYGLALNRAAITLRNGINISQVRLKSRNSLGVLYVTNEDNFRGCTENNTGELIFDVDADVDKINTVLSEIRYQSNIYDIESREIIDVTWNSYLVSIHVHIKRPERPFLYDPGESGNINSKVTVITKTFERYPAVKRLISSVRKFYPGITILIADDSEYPEKIKIPNVKQYIMPFAEGWFAGRNLLLSQVRTKYFLWVDDDFVFTDGTRLERFVEKFEHPNVTVDHVSGTFGDEFGTADVKSNCYGCRRLEFQYGDDEGGCLMIRTWTQYHKVYQFPQCFWADGTTNFFMSRTSSARKTGFDPYFRRTGHPEYFVDSLGKVRVMGCTDVNILHKPYRSNPEYNKFRKIDRKDEKKKHLSFKNNLKCIEYL
ncbi:beta-1,4 N-acetylgalactosaminyltransferase 1-like [Ptychodera flava]|uniref:beta-1,4 N-acetylgalactosaminyltransferase 1-like n=1 Tax=Ptychodera flava TaxID=63121 RepID=UPI003969E975